MPKVNHGITPSSNNATYFAVGGCGIHYTSTTEKQHNLKIRLHKKCCEVCRNAIHVSHEYTVSEKDRSIGHSNRDTVIKESEKVAKQLDIEINLGK